MAKCVEFWQKWKREPNFCGVGTQTAKSFDLYLKLADEISEEYGIPVEVIYRNAPQTALKPILRFAKSSKMRQTVKQAVAETIKSKHAITAKYINSVMGREPVRVFVPEPKTKIAPLSAERREIIATNSISDKIRLMRAALSPGQISVLSDIIRAGYAEDEHGAIAVALKWAGEKLASATTIG